MGIIFFVNNEQSLRPCLQHTNAFLSPSQRHCPASEANDTGLHTTNTVATKEPTPKPQGICSVGDYAVCKKKIKDVGELRQRIVEEWEQLSQHVIDNAIRQWRRRLRGGVDADGGQFEHSL